MRAPTAPRPTSRRATRVRPLIGPLVGLALAASGCSLAGSSDDSSAAPDPASGTPSASGSASGTPAPGSGGKVVLVTHESFTLPQKLIARFEQQTGYDLVVRASGDAGVLTNKLVLTAGDPEGDVSFGVDNTFGSRAVDAGVFEPYTGAGAEAVTEYDLAGDDAHALTPIDHGSVCVNVDDTWFDERGLEPPTTLDDLTDPAYEDLFVLPGAATSSTGLAFLLTTVAAYGDQWPQYWADLMDNGAKLTAGWSDAYFVDFTQGGEDGTRPIVLSYDSSPAFTTTDDGTSTTSALLDTCFRQVEYAGVLAGAQNPAGAQAFVDYLLTPAVQKALPDSMYVFPDVPGTPLPEEWARFAVQPDRPWSLDPAEIADQRDAWLTEWTDVTTR